MTINTFWDYAKPVASVLTLFIAIIGLLSEFNVEKPGKKAGDPPHRTLTRPGQVALIVVLVSGLISAVGETRDVQAKQNDAHDKLLAAELHQKNNTTFRKKEKTRRMKEAGRRSRGRNKSRAGRCSSMRISSLLKTVSTLTT